MRIKYRCLMMLPLLFCLVVGEATEADGGGETEEERMIRESAEAPGGDYLQKLLVDLEHDSEPALSSILKFLRSRDEKVVRLRISAEAKGKQRGFALLDQLPNTLKYLSDENPEMRVKAAELVHLLSAENKHMAQMIGLQSWLPGSNGIPQLVALVEKACAAEATDAEIRAGEEAVEAIHSLTVTSRDNLELSHDNQAAEFLIDAVRLGKTARTRMWAAAGLQRLLADIYDTEDGRYDSNVRRIYNAEPTRVEAEIIIEDLVRMIKENRVKKTTPRERWPTYIQRSASDQTTIEAWAAAAAVSTIAQSESFHSKFRKAGAFEAVCSLKSSPDGLERSQALAAISSLDYDCEADSGGEEL